VLLPVRNGEDYLEAAIASIRQQTFGDWKLVVVDDGSPDATRSIIDRHVRGDPRVEARPNAGAGLIDALNTGLAAAAPLVARMDADDVAHPDRLKRQIVAFESRPDLVALGGQVRCIDAKGGALGAWRYPVGVDVCRERLQFSSPLCHPAVMMRADAVRRLCGYRRPYRHAEDYDLWLRLAEVGEIDNLGDMLLDYRVHSTSVTSQNSHIQAMNAALARLAANDRARGEADPTPESGWIGETVEEVCDNHGLSGSARQRGVLAYWRALVLSGGVRNLDVLLKFRERLSDLAVCAAQTGESEAFASLALRAAYLAGKARSPLAAAQCLAWSMTLAPGAAVRNVADRLGVRLPAA